jgi:MFS family permease
MKATFRPTLLSAADRLGARGVLLILLALYTATMSGLPGNPDAEVEFQTTRSLARGEGLAISPATPEGAAIIAHQFDVRRGSDGRSYSWFGVGQALAGVPFYWLGQGLAELLPQVEERHAATFHYGQPRSEYFAHLLVGWRNPLLGALTAWLLALTVRRLGVSRPVSLVSALGYGLCTYAWPQARDGLSDVQASFLGLLALHLLVQLREQFWALEPPRRRTLAALGAALGAMVATRIVTAPVALVLTVATLYVVIVGRRRLWSMPLLQGQAGAARAVRDLAWFGAPALGIGLALATINWLRFGDPLESGYSAAVSSGTFFSYPGWFGLLGVTVAPGKGLLWHAPALLLAVLGFLRLRRDRMLVLTCLAVSAAIFLPVIHTQTFHGAWTYGPRYLLPALPFLWLGTAAGIDALRRTRWRALAPALLALGLLSALGGVLVDQSTHHDLALQAARSEWQQLDDPTESGRDDQRFVMIQWDWRFAAPWAHWRILRHRAAGLPERYAAEQLYFVEPLTAALEPTHDRDRGFRHLAWVDLEQRLDGSAWPAVALAGVLLALGVIQLLSALDPTRP